MTPDKAPAVGAVPQGDDIPRFEESLDEERSDGGVLQCLIAVMQPASLGEYVRYADHAALLAERDARIAELYAGLREARRWIGDGDMSDDLNPEYWSRAYAAAVDQVDALLRGDG